METLTLDISEAFNLTDEQLFLLCSSNKEINIERNFKGDLIFMAPAGATTSSINIDITSQLFNWNKKNKRGKTFGPDGGFILPNNAMRSPDAAFITQERWEKIPLDERKKFPRICPDFVIELLSESDKIEAAKAKMNEWMNNGCLLSWLIDTKNEYVYIYRIDGSKTTVNGFDNILSGENILPGFNLNLNELRDI